MGDSRIVTKAGLERMQQRLSDLEQRLRAIRKAKAEAAELGGNAWHDNAAFETLELDERMLIRQIAELRSNLQNARPREETVSSGVVAPGAVVTVRFKDGETMTLTLVGSEEGDPDRGMISCDSPLGRALLGARAGDRRSYRVGRATFHVIVERVDQEDA